MGSPRHADLSSRLAALGLALAALSIAGCGERVTCWCRCPPHDQAYEYSEVSAAPPSCDELCQAEGCTWEQESECLPDEAQRCACEGGLYGLQTCNASGFWSPCASCNTRLCEEGAQQVCQCRGGGTGSRRCVLGGWTEWEGCAEGCEPAPVALEVHGDADQGAEGVTIGGAVVDEFDTTLWGCPALPPGADNLIWRLPFNDGAAAESRWLEFYLPANLLDLEVEYRHLAATDGVNSSALEVLINDVNHGEVFEATEGCVEAERVRYSLDSFVLDGLNRVELWSADNGSGLNHGLQGVWISGHVPAP